MPPKRFARNCTKGEKKKRRKDRVGKGKLDAEPEAVQCNMTLALTERKAGTSLFGHLSFIDRNVSTDQIWIATYRKNAYAEIMFAKKIFKQYRAEKKSLYVVW